MDLHAKETETEQFLTFYKHVLDQINEGVHVVDHQGTSVVYNRKMTELESMNEDDVLGVKLLNVFRFLGGQESTLLQALNGKRTLNVRQTYFNDKGKKITTLNNTYPIIQDGRVIGAVEIANDVTKMERLIRGNMLEQRKDGAGYTFDQIIGSGSALQEVIEHAKRAARTSSSVLVAGETGTGKELFVQSIHNASSRSGAPMISQNCAALPDSLIESLLFGTARGAFTGAIERPGLFEQAEGGTLFLDEINSLSLPLQAKLLRALQEKSIRRVGDTKDKSINVRIIAAMNEDPEAAMEDGHIRRDLYYRLGVVTLLLPPLRERMEDIPELVRFFIKKYNALFQMEVQGISEEVKSFFLRHDWPGNVRELQHIIEGAMNLMEHEPIIEIQHLPIHRSARMSLKASKSAEKGAARAFEEQIKVDIKHPKTLKEQLNDFETLYVRSVVNKHQGNISRAAKDLGLSRQSLQYRMKKLGIKG